MSQQQCTSDSWNSTEKSQWFGYTVFAFLKLQFSKENTIRFDNSQSFRVTVCLCGKGTTETNKSLTPTRKKNSKKKEQIVNMNINMVNETKATNRKITSADQKLKEHYPRLMHTEQTIIVISLVMIAAATVAAAATEASVEGKKWQEKQMLACDIPQLPSHIRLNERYYLIINKIEYACRMLWKEPPALPQHWAFTY